MSSLINCIKLHVKISQSSYLCRKTAVHIVEQPGTHTTIDLLKENQQHILMSVTYTCVILFTALQLVVGLYYTIISCIPHVLMRCKIVSGFQSVLEVSAYNQERESLISRILIRGLRFHN